MPNKREKGNLVVLVFTRDYPFVGVRSAIKALGPFTLGIDMNCTNWSTDWGKVCVRHLPIGTARLLDYPDAPLSGIIGVYDRTDFEHIEQMVKDAFLASFLISKNILISAQGGV